MIQLGQLSLFVMAQLALRLPFQSVYVPRLHTYTSSTLRDREEVSGEEEQRECPNNRIMHKSLRPIIGINRALVLSKNYYCETRMLRNA